jgi:transposase
MGLSRSTYYDGEDVTETLELIPRQWKVVQHVREKFSCRACEGISQPAAPSHPSGSKCCMNLFQKPG